MPDPGYESIPLGREGCHWLRTMGEGAGEGRKEKEGTLSITNVKQVKLPR